MKTMIWTDASFAIEWLGGTKRAADVNPKPGRRIAILPLQYAEVCAFFLRGNRKFSPSLLDSMELVHADADELLQAAFYYGRARAAGSKASMADAVLAATVRSHGGVLYGFDEDFRFLGLQQESPGRWTRA
jgi:predicted nucleic acid-binding protein